MQKALIRHLGTNKCPGEVGIKPGGSLSTNVLGCLPKVGLPNVGLPFLREAQCAIEGGSDVFPKSLGRKLMQCSRFEKFKLSQRAFCCSRSDGGGNKSSRFYYCHQPKGVATKLNSQFPYVD